MERDRITEDHIATYLSKTRKALDHLRVAPPERSYLKSAADDFLSMAQAYFDDAKHFYENGDFINAFACVNYSHGWLDAGARLGLWDVDGDDQLFTLYE